MRDFAAIVAGQSLTKISCTAGVEALWVSFASEDVNVSKLSHFSRWLAEP